MPVEVYIDGASAGDPGLSGLGIFIKNGRDSESFSLPAGRLSNHEAEFMALIEGMKLCADRRYSIVSFRTDSQIVERAADSEYVKNPAFKPYLDEIIRLKAAFDLFFIKWIPSKENQTADKLAKHAILLNPAD
ncbi:reverse transcriptase-like protein [Bacillus sonorensis]|uniref:Ribonuclease H n=2 Tax=Bacillus sonorensis TaxID=119858 RepID=M5PA97_9BACI|nr:MULTISPECIES: reverse transcriptase-like protein [Bacillus]TWK82491.1 14.7 kDa ribonuclease H-like protein [Bacillus paralicheniformis]ASB88776.1 Ribonuclease H [Bacillus sonorensis]EME76414.1 ribonuclease H [Bacillus sonorensis L12]MBG9915424.1 ribonuclease H [Bacillus sonorensis]MCF7618130.1 reverse transcriptase-like protein [Bacillus sonorensis]